MFCTFDVLLGRMCHIYIIIYLQYVQYVKQNFMKDQHLLNFIFKEKSMPLGSPQLRLLLTGMLQEVLL